MCLGKGVREGRGWELEDVSRMRPYGLGRGIEELALLIAKVWREAGKQKAHKRTNGKVPSCA